MRKDMKEELEKIFYDMCEMYHETKKREDTVKRCQIAMYIMQFYQQYYRN